MEETSKDTPTSETPSQKKGMLVWVVLIVIAAVIAIGAMLVLYIMSGSDYQAQLQSQADKLAGCQAELSECSDEMQMMEEEQEVEEETMDDTSELEQGRLISLDDNWNLYHNTDWDLTLEVPKTTRGQNIFCEFEDGTDSTDVSIPVEVFEDAPSLEDGRERIVIATAYHYDNQDGTCIRNDLTSADFALGESPVATSINVYLMDLDAEQRPEGGVQAKTLDEYIDEVWGEGCGEGNVLPGGRVELSLEEGCSNRDFRPSQTQMVYDSQRNTVVHFTANVQDPVWFFAGSQEVSTPRNLFLR